MGNFSKPPAEVLKANQEKGYISVHIEQGVPLLDRDLNLMHDLTTERLRSIIAQYLGDGVLEGSDAFRIEPIPPDFTDCVIKAGTVLINGWEVINPRDIKFSEQPGHPDLQVEEKGKKTDQLISLAFYLDVSLSEATSDTDPDLKNNGDVGLQTSVRQKVNWVVRLGERIESLTLRRVPQPVSMIFSPEHNVSLLVEDMDSTVEPTVHGVGVSSAPVPGHIHFPLAVLELRHGRFEKGSGEHDLRRKLTPLTGLTKRFEEMEQRLEKMEQFARRPMIFGLSPASGEPGTRVIVIGKNFGQGEAEFLYNGQPFHPDFMVHNAIGFTIPANETQEQILVEVRNRFGLYTFPRPFKVMRSAAPAPGQVLGFAPAGAQFSPTSAPHEAVVVIHGQGFASGMAVAFVPIQGQPEEVPVSLVQVFSPNEARIAVPREMPAGQFRMRLLHNQQFRTSDDLFTLAVAPPTPRFAAPGQQIDPRVAAPGVPIRINGENFTPGMEVVLLPMNLDGGPETVAPAEVQFVSAQQLIIQKKNNTLFKPFKIRLRDSQGHTVFSDDILRSRAIEPPAFNNRGFQFSPASGAPGSTFFINGRNLSDNVFVEMIPEQAGPAPRSILSVHNSDPDGNMMSVSLPSDIPVGRYKVRLNATLTSEDTFEVFHSQ